MSQTPPALAWGGFAQRFWGGGAGKMEKISVRDLGLNYHVRIYKYYLEAL